MTEDTSITDRLITDRLMAETAATLERIADLSDELFRLSGQLWVISNWAGQRQIFDWSEIANDAGLQVEELQWSVRDVIRGITFTLPIRPLDDREFAAGPGIGSCHAGDPLDGADQDG
ncbi:hypothetical protein [Mycobacterium sp.]|uniref:hypothetical protein n=1 Tax=Mycobacterium sp. TaxID=1785 RepID=UPI003F976DDA